VTGDLDGMVKRRFIRILTVYSKTLYTVDKGVPRGAAFDAGRLFVEDLNKKLAKEKKLQQKHVKVQALFIRSVGANCCRRWLPAKATSRWPASA